MSTFSPIYSPKDHKCHRFMMSIRMSNVLVGRIINFKVVLVGDSGVGKTSLVQRFVNGSYTDTEECTIGAAFAIKALTLDNTIVKFEIWDTAGQERYKNLAPMYYKGAQAAIVVYDITNQDSLDTAKAWVKELMSKVNNIVIAIVGNKADLEDEREVEAGEVNQYYDDQDHIFFETSAKVSTNVNNLFCSLYEKLRKSYDEIDGRMRVAEKSIWQRLKQCCW